MKQKLKKSSIGTDIKDGEGVIGRENRGGGNAAVNGVVLLEG